MLKQLASVCLSVILFATMAAAATIGTSTATPNTVPASVATVVTFTSIIADPTVIPSTVNLLQVDSAGRSTVIGLMHDDGLNGDAVANDHTYSFQLNLFQQITGNLTYRVSAGFQGSLLRVLSAPITVTVTGTSTGVTIASPASAAYLNISPTVVTGTVSNANSSVSVNNIPAQLSGTSFSVSVPLREGINTLTAVVMNGGASATASETVTLDTTPPHVTIDTPGDNSTTTDSSINVGGIVNDIVVGTVNPLQASVTINGVPAQVMNRTYVGSVPLQLGANTITATARDRAGNFATTSITVIRQTATQPTLRIISGNNLTGSIRTLLAAPLVVQALSGTGQPLVNIPVVFQVTGGDGLVSAGTGGPMLPSVAVNTNAQGQAQVNFTLGSRSGAGNNMVQASAAGIASTPVFTESATATTPALIVVDSGNNQSGVVGQALPLPFIAIVTDAGHNRLGNVPVSFTATSGGGSFGGQNATTATSDSDGRVEVVLTLGPQAGINNNVVTANFTGNTGLAATFTATSYIPGPVQNTSITGVVLDNSNIPIPGVTMRLFQVNNGGTNNLPQQVVTPVQTNAQGFFSIQPAPVGVFKLMADGATATRPGPFPTLEYDMVTVAGQNNTVGLPIFLPQLAGGSQLCVSPAVGGTLTIPQAPGFALTIAAGSATFPGGSQTGCVSVTPVNMDKVPMVPGFGQQPRFIVTIQPVGTIFNPPAQITIPNVDGLAPRAVTEMYSYDHDLATFTAIGTGTVSADGSVIASDPGVGVIKAGWHCGGDPNSSGSSASLSVSLNPTLAVKGAGSQFNITASGSPPLDGTYTWEIIATQPGDDAGVAQLVQSPSCNNQSTCTAVLKGIKGGKATLRVHFKCLTTGAEVTADARVTIVQVTSIDVTIPHITNCSQCTGVAAFADDTFSSSSSSDDFTANAPLAMPRKSETANLVCNTTPANTDPGVLSVLKWQIKRNPGSGSTPALTPSGATATLGFDDQGSFNTFCFADSNGNTQADTDESKISLNLALVGITVNTFVPTAHTDLLAQTTPSATAVGISSAGTGGGFDFSHTDQAGFYLSSTITLTGGGADGKLGVDKITVFFLQNFKNDTYAGNYTGGKTAKEVFVCNASTTDPICSGSPTLMSFPVLDNASTGFPTGGSTPGAPCCHQETNVGGDVTQRKLEWLDSPAFGSAGLQPCDNTKTLISTSGSNAFAVYMMSFSQQATHTYVANGEADWTVTASGPVAADSSGNLIWTKGTGAGITASQVTTGYPKNANGASIMVYGPSFGAGNLKTDGR